MIRDTLIPELARRFADLGLRLGDSPDPIATIPAKHPDVGDVTIFDEGHEVTVAIGKIMHHHHNPDDYGQPCSGVEREQWITRSVVDFLDKLIADRILIWVSRSSRSAGMSDLRGPLRSEDIEEVSQYAGGEAFISGPAPSSRPR